MIEKLKKYQSPFSLLLKSAGLLMLFSDFLQDLEPILHKTIYKLAKIITQKRLETDVPSLRNPVIMRRTRLRFPFGDRCSTN